MSFVGTEMKHVQVVIHCYSSTYGFILNMSLTPIPSLCLFRSLTSFSLVQVMWTRSAIPPEALSLAAE